MKKLEIKSFIAKTMLVSAATMMCLSGCGEKLENESGEIKQTESVADGGNGAVSEDNGLDQSLNENLSDYDNEVDPGFDYEDEDEVVYDDIEDEPAYKDAEARADKVIANMDKFLTALKNGDIDTFLPYLEDDTDMKEIFEKTKDKEAMGELLRILLADMDWTYEGRCMEELTQCLYDGDDELVLDVYVCGPMQLYYDHYYCANLPAGTVLPEDYEPASEEEAKEVIKKMVSLTPIVGNEDLQISDIKEDGSFVVDIDLLFHMDHAGLEDASYANGSNIYRTYVKELFDIGTDYVYNVEGRGQYEKDDEIREELLEMIFAKDFEALDARYVELTGNESKIQVKYADLTPEQQKMVDDIIENEVVITYENKLRARDDMKVGAVIITYPAKYMFPSSADYVEWADEHQVVETVALLENLANVESTANYFGYYYSRILEYVSKQ